MRLRRGLYRQNQHEHWAAVAEGPSKGCYLRPSVVTLRRQAPQDLIQSYKVKAIALRNTHEEDIKQEGGMCDSRGIWPGGLKWSDDRSITAFALAGRYLQEQTKRVEHISSSVIYSFGLGHAQKSEVYGKNRFFLGAGWATELIVQLVDTAIWEQ